MKNHSQTLAWVCYVPGSNKAEVYADYQAAWLASEAEQAKTGRVACVEPIRQCGSVFTAIR